MSDERVGWLSKIIGGVNFGATWIERTLTVIAGAGLVIVMVLVTVGALGRHLFGAPIAGSEIFVGVFLAPLVTYFAAAGALSQRQHVGVTALVTRMGPRTRKIAQIVGALLTAVIFGTIAYQGWLRTLKAIQTHQVETNVNLPLYLAYGVIPLGCLMLALRAILLAVEWARGSNWKISLARQDG